MNKAGPSGGDCYTRPRGMHDMLWPKGRVLGYMRNVMQEASMAA
jgi:hypothetical protein